jgi:hypothetical protein
VPFGLVDWALRHAAAPDRELPPLRLLIFWFAINNNTAFNHPSHLVNAHHAHP